MFDGKHTSRRTINLSKATRRNRSATSRSTILRKSKEQREKRLKENQRLQAVTTIQRFYRGYKNRLTIVKALLGLVMEPRVYQVVLHDGLSAVERISGLLLKHLTPFVKDLKSSLLRFAREIKLQPEFCVEDSRYLLYSRVVVQTLVLLQEAAIATGVDANTTAEEEIRLLMDLLLSIFELASASMRNKMTCCHKECDAISPIEMELITCIQKWLWKNCVTDVCVSYILDLFTISNKVLQSQPNSKFKGYLAGIIIGAEMHHSRMLYSQMRVQIQGKTLKDDLEWYMYQFETLYKTIFSCQNQPSVAVTVPDIIIGREAIFLNNGFEILSKINPQKNGKFRSLQLMMIKLMGMLFDPMIYADVGVRESSMQCRSLIILSGLAAKGVNIGTLHHLNGEIDAMNIIDLTEHDIDSDHEEGIDMDVHEEPAIVLGNTVTTSRTNRPSNDRNLRRQDLQTTHKLDQTFKHKLSQAQNEATTWLRGQRFSNHSIVQLLCQTAEGIGGGDIIVKLIPAAFQKNNDTQNQIRGIFCTFLSTILQNCTGGKARDSAMSPLLSKLAFNSTFMDELWAYVQYQLHCSSSAENDCCREHEAVKSYSAITCFCDLFSHQLMALDDEEFLLSFTDMNPTGKAMSHTLALDVIVNIKNILYEVYWSKPITVDDCIVPASPTTGSIGREVVVKHHKARLLLSGTKLWNSIHARWSRLYRTHKFCEEELWIFPHLVTRDQDEKGAVDSRAPSAIINMEEDDDSVDSVMEIDEEFDTENDTLASSFKDPKMARILTSIPQALPFDRRAKLFSSLLSTDIMKTQDETAAMQNMMWNMQRGIEGAEFTGRERVKIRRDELYMDSMSQLNKLGQRLKKKVQVTFISEHGNVEAGVDGGGLFKEFLDDLITNAFDPTHTHDSYNFGGPLFVESSLQTLAVNTNLMLSREMLTHYQFLGRVLGKAVYESILVEPQFCLPFLNQLLGQHNTIDDLKNIDPVYYKHLRSLRNMSNEEIKSLDLTFEMTAASEGSQSRTSELIPGGSSIRVTKDNAVRYVHLVAHRRLNMETAAQINAMRSGFRDLVPASWVRLFSPYELQKVISGDDTIKGFDVKGLKSVMEYAGGFHPSQPIMIWFWEVIDEMTPVQKSKFLKFVTSCSRQPLLGFRALSPLPCIHQVRVHEIGRNLDAKELKLPTSATCMNLLKLPDYQSKKVLQEKLLYAIESGAGFELS